MKKYKKENLTNIKSIVQDKTGIDTTNTYRIYGIKNFSYGKAAIAAACVLCLGIFSAFAYQRFNSLKGDDLALKALYCGDGKFEIIITNLSDKKLVLEDRVRLMKWSDSKPVDGEPKKVKISNLSIPAGETGVVHIDISEGYNINEMKEDLSDGDWYYFVLTNNRFAFGQDWMCSIDFEIDDSYALSVPESTSPDITPTDAEAVNDGSSPADSVESSDIEGTYRLTFSDWALPAKSLDISSFFGEYTSPANPDKVFYSNHISIAGNEGDPIYAVCDGTITYAGFDSKWGYQIILSDGNNTYIMYGHLQEILVNEGDSVSRGDIIALMGKTGMATGPNLAFSVNVNGEYVDPISK